MLEVQKYVQQQNILRFQELLLRLTDEKQRKQIEILLAEEKAKSKPAGAKNGDNV